MLNVCYWSYSCVINTNRIFVKIRYYENWGPEASGLLVCQILFHTGKSLKKENVMFLYISKYKNIKIKKSFETEKMTK